MYQQIQINNFCHYFQQGPEDMRDKDEEGSTEKILVFHIFFQIREMSLEFFFIVTGSSFSTLCSSDPKKSKSSSKYACTSLQATH